MVHLIVSALRFLEIKSRWGKWSQLSIIRILDLIKALNPSDVEQRGKDKGRRGCKVASAK